MSSPVYTPAQKYPGHRPLTRVWDGKDATGKTPPKGSTGHRQNLGDMLDGIKSRNLRSPKNTPEKMG